MVGLLDIAPLTQNVKVRGKDVEVKGLGGRAVAHLLSRFPEFRKIMADRALNLTADEIMELAPRAGAAIVAAAMGKPGDEKLEEHIADEMVLGEQLELLAAAVEMTFPNGFSVLTRSVDRLTGALPQGLDAASVDTGKAPDTKSPSPSKQ